MTIQPDIDPRISGLGQVSRTVRNIDESELWYRDVLGLKHLFTVDQLAFFDCGGTRVMLSQNEELHEAESLLYFRVPDIEVAHRALVEQGIEFIQAPTMIHRHEDGTEEWMAFFKDPEGRPLALMSARKSAAA
jgi:catechol 2,3-dioxygenase-like lactoylglutathione lyase family enzyme